MSPSPLLVAHSPAMQPLVQRLPRIAASNGPVLLRGERGAGKRQIAQELHRLGPHPSGPWVVGGDAAGGSDAEPLPFDAARGGTLYIDELCTLGLAGQAALLRRLEDADASAANGGTSRKDDPRIVVATRRDLAQEVDSKRLRAELVRRLQPVEVDVPPLRDRREDVEPLFTAFFTSCAPATAERPAAAVLTRRALAVLVQHAWPGNVRELECLARLLACAAGPGPVDAVDLPPHFFSTRAAPNASSGVPPLADVERRHILAIYEHAGRNKRRASDLLGISLRTLYNKLTEYHVHGAGNGVANGVGHEVTSGATNGVRDGGLDR